CFSLAYVIYLYYLNKKEPSIEEGLLLVSFYNETMKALLFSIAAKFIQKNSRGGSQWILLQ
ncbi:hypothetical protein, partial [Lacrimispora sp. 38-1]|uniref:hypothetical protein n=1 Tax=Lacrimispora sp. 38-1 TaxID=3125778 RepID=UPI003CEFB4ED